MLLEGKECHSNLHKSMCTISDHDNPDPVIRFKISLCIADPLLFHESAMLRVQKLVRDLQLFSQLIHAFF